MTAKSLNHIMMVTFERKFKLQLTLNDELLLYR